MQWITVLLSLTVGEVPDSNSDWLPDYGVALRQARLEGVPLLVILEDLDETRGRVLPVASRRDSDQAELLQNYKLCRIDVGTDYGKAVAKVFKVATFPHTVIIDKTASVQIFRKSGPFAAGELTAVLVRYQSGNRPLPASWTFPTFGQSSPANCFT